MEVKGEYNRHLLVLERGEPLVSRVTQYCHDNQLAGAAISGLGALCHVELGYYELEKQVYERRLFDKTDYELINLTGNFTMKDDEPFTHVHAVLSGPDFQAFGGHLFEATVAVTAEVMLLELGALPQRQYQESVGLHLICRLCDV